jgi:hypothetical protein
LWKKQWQSFSENLGMKNETYLHHKLHGSRFDNNSCAKFPFHRFEWNIHKCHSSTYIVQTSMSCALFRHEYMSYACFYCLNMDVVCLFVLFTHESCAHNFRV